MNKVDMNGFQTAIYLSPVPLAPREEPCKCRSHKSNTEKGTGSCKLFGLHLPYYSTNMRYEMLKTPCKFCLLVYSLSKQVAICTHTGLKNCHLSSDAKCLSNQHQKYLNRTAPISNNIQFLGHLKLLKQHNTSLLSLHLEVVVTAFCLVCVDIKIDLM